jgi:hypothetical protein
MGTHCNVAFYESEQADLLGYQFMLYKRRGGDLWGVGPLLALSILEVVEMFQGATEQIHLATEKIKNYHLDRLGQDGFRPPRFISEDIFLGGEDVDYFFAVYSNSYDLGKIDVYTPTIENWEFYLTYRTLRYLELEESRRGGEAELGLEFSPMKNLSFGLQKIKSIDLLGMLRNMPR